MSEVPKRCDVLIAGSGPGGSMAATFLRQKGYDVVLMERRRHPRPNVGESLIPHFWTYTDAAGVTDRLVAERFIAKAGAFADWEGERRHMAFRNYGFSRPALHVERDVFDHILFNHAVGNGAQAFEDCTVQDVEPGETVVTRYVHAEAGAGTIASRFMIDATGQQALLGRHLDVRQADDDFRFVAIWGYFEGSSYMAADGTMQPPENARTIAPTTFVTGLPYSGAGWCWHIQLRESTSVGLIVPTERIRQARSQPGGLEAFFLQQCAELPQLSILLQRARFIPGSLNVINNYSYTSARMTAPGCFMIGDASGFIDPIFSIGVTLAMYGAFTAAWAIDRSLRNAERAESSRAIFEQQIQTRMAVSRALCRPAFRAPAYTEGRLKAAMRLYSTAEHGLIRDVTGLSGRSINFERMSDPAAA
ncbi:NAD(P)/FAD-dependent oxidoreductase [Sphingomonas canadensis]|uniref:NAD(P)/FAD-dependent oxidoreductase n=1 Tax=Sphingomonas canadensis TaxID=1219257 RepID=A0ABW3H9X0_9SPHN|nr:NAD(P)/FAD-dependent oxidoreductase [Sphingomonas canadensis]MCW3836910.1 tryptophan 7-halogenase [Sphingomonas canadensis]